jgi:adhesin HecA-like repeat protein
MNRFHRRLLVGVLIISAGLVMNGPALASHQDPVTVVASGLDNPRGLLVGPGGVLLVAEAGSGGPGPCVPAPTNPAIDICLGASGAVTALVPRRSASWPQHRIVDGLPSLAGPGGTNALGVHDLAYTAGRLYATMGLGGNEQMRAAIGPAGALMGQLVRLRPSGQVTPVADLLEYERVHDPDAGDVGAVVDSNPYGLLGVAGGRAVVADAAGNTVLAIDRHGSVSTVAVLHVSQAPAPPFLGLPPGTLIPMQSVPTSVVRGPDGALYVGQLTGFPFPPGGAAVWRIDSAGTPVAHATGFTNIIDIAFDRRGRLLVLSLARDGLLNAPPGAPPAGALFRVERDGSRTELAAGRLVAPGGVAVAADGTIYVTNRSIESDVGEVLRIRA